ncbi:hypothetical protein ACFOPN_08215 [Xanthomonas hyacinthi]|uniref:hypothetical protein n=1 Tax=Xanthomonas hyacinthi TaxID=56455 RepID=UPI0036198BBD
MAERRAQKFAVGREHAQSGHCAGLGEVVEDGIPDGRRTASDRAGAGIAPVRQELARLADLRRGVLFDVDVDGNVVARGCKARVGFAVARRGTVQQIFRRGCERSG